MAYADFAYRIYFWGDEIEAIHRVDPYTGKKQADERMITIYPANLFVTAKDTQQVAIHEIQDDLVETDSVFRRRAALPGGQAHPGAHRVLTWR